MLKIPSSTSSSTSRPGSRTSSPVSSACSSPSATKALPLKPHAHNNSSSPSFSAPDAAPNDRERPGLAQDQAKGSLANESSTSFTSFSSSTNSSTWSSSSIEASNSRQELNSIQPLSRIFSSGAYSLPSCGRIGLGSFPGSSASGATIGSGATVTSVAHELGSSASADQNPAQDDPTQKSCIAHKKSSSVSLLRPILSLFTAPTTTTISTAATALLPSSSSASIPTLTLNSSGINSPGATLDSGGGGGPKRLSSCWSNDDLPSPIYNTHGSAHDFSAVLSRKHQDSESNQVAPTKSLEGSDAQIGHADDVLSTLSALPAASLALEISTHPPLSPGEGVVDFTETIPSQAQHHYNNRMDTPLLDLQEQGYVVLLGNHGAREFEQPNSTLASTLAVLTSQRVDVDDQFPSLASADSDLDPRYLEMSLTSAMEESDVEEEGSLLDRPSDLLRIELKGMEDQVEEQAVLGSAEPILIDYDFLLRTCLEDYERAQEDDLWLQRWSQLGLEEKEEEEGAQGMNMVDHLENSCIINMDELLGYVSEDPVLKKVQFHPEIHIITSDSSDLYNADRQDVFAGLTPLMDKASPGWRSFKVFQTPEQDQSPWISSPLPIPTEDEYLWFLPAIPEPGQNEDLILLPALPSVTGDEQLSLLPLLPVANAEECLWFLPSLPAPTKDEELLLLPELPTASRQESLELLPALPMASLSEYLELLPALPPSPIHEDHGPFFAVPHPHTSKTKCQQHNNMLLLPPLRIQLDQKSTSPATATPTTTVATTIIAAAAAAAAASANTVSTPITPRAIELASTRRHLLYWAQTAAQLQVQEQWLTARIEGLVKEVALAIEMVQDSEVDRQNSERALQELRQEIVKEQELAFASVQEAALSIQEKKLLEMALEASWKELDLLKSAWTAEQIRRDRQRALEQLHHHHHHHHHQQQETQPLPSPQSAQEPSTTQAPCLENTEFYTPSSTSLDPSILTSDTAPRNKTHTSHNSSNRKESTLVFLFQTCLLTALLTAALLFLLGPSYQDLYPLSPNLVRSNFGPSWLTTASVEETARAWAVALSWSMDSHSVFQDAGSVNWAANVLTWWEHQGQRFHEHSMEPILEMLVRFYQGETDQIWKAFKVGRLFA